MIHFSNAFKSKLSLIECECEYKAAMAKHTSFKTGGAADLLVIPKSTQALSSILEAVRDEGCPLTVIGKGSNLLVSDGGIRGVTLKTAGGLGGIKRDGEYITCGAGASLKSLCMAALENSLSGLEFAYGIPGSAGGAAYMNAGAYGGEMKDAVESVSHMDFYGKEGKMTATELDFSYRHSVYCDNNYIITEITLKLNSGDQSEIKAKMDDFMRRRKDKQPLEFPSAGSTFKRPEGYFVGALLEELGMKGFSIGGAKVSEKHAGFVVNAGNATSADILNLINYIKTTVYEKKGVTLETEVRMLGFE